METLEEMRSRHRSVARYTVAVSSRGSQIPLFTGVQYLIAVDVCGQLQAEWIKTLPDKRASFGTPVHTMIIENELDCISEAARKRRLITGATRVKAAHV